MGWWDGVSCDWVDLVLLPQHTARAETAPHATYSRRWGTLSVPQSFVSCDSCATVTQNRPWKLPYIMSLPDRFPPSATTSPHDAWTKCLHTVLPKQLYKLVFLSLPFLATRPLSDCHSYHHKRLSHLPLHSWWGTPFGKSVLQATSNLDHWGHKLQTSLWSRCGHVHRVARFTSLPHTKESGCTWTLCVLGSSHSSGSSRTSYWFLAASLPFSYSWYTLHLQHHLLVFTGALCQPLPRAEEEGI